MNQIPTYTIHSVSYTHLQDYREAFHMGIATGSASAFSEYLAGREQVEDVYRQVTSEVR